MFMHLQQLDPGLQTANRKSGDAGRGVELKANFALLLELIIIPATSGEVLIT